MLIAALSEDGLGGIATLADVDRAEQLVDAYQAEVLRKAADKLDESETLRDLTDDHMHDVNAAANELRHMADGGEAL